jgi:hypothetical protein
MITHRRSAIAMLGLLVALIAAAAAPVVPPTIALAAGSQLSSSPAAISSTVVLGATRRVTLTLQNGGSVAVQPRLYEALASSAPAASLSAAVPTALARVALPQQDRRVDAQLSAAVEADPQGPTTFLVFLSDQADLSGAYAISDWQERGRYVYETLRDHARVSQAGLRSFLNARGAEYTPLWIVNALAVRGDAADVAALAGRSDVAMLRANRLMAFGDPPGEPAAALDAVDGCLANAANVCWNVARVGADRVWDNFGVRGAGITVASIDSGVRYDHPALVAQYRGNRGGSSFDHNYNWYDPYGSALAPADSGNHGTHTMGTIVAKGGASADEPAVGVAPGARWIAARACGSRDCSEASLIEAAQWMLAPTDLSGQSPRPDLRPQIINNSWSTGAGDDAWYTGYVAAWRASGIFPVFAAGNTGNSSGCGTVQSPGDYAQAVAVGALDSANSLASYSSIGPSADGRLKPDITAPGSGIASTFADLTQIYNTLSGTSMATPHVVGSVALLWSANPSLIGDYDRTYQLLGQTAVPVTSDARFDSEFYESCHVSASPNNIYGYGRLDAYAAVAATSVDVPWLSLPVAALSAIGPAGSASVELTLDARRVAGPGTYQARVLVHDTDLSQAPLVIPVMMTVPADPSYATLTGKVTRLADGSPLAATVTVAGGATVSTDAAGAYRIILPPSATSYALTARSFGYAPQNASVTLGAGAGATRNFALDTDAARLDVVANPQAASTTLGKPGGLSFTLRNEGTRPLTYSARIVEGWYGVWSSEQADGPAAGWIDPPASATTVGLDDDGFSDPISIGFGFQLYSSVYTSLSIGANGIISFSPLLSESSFYVASCLPLSETPDAALIPLRVDLDPSEAGARVSYARLAQGFLVSWEDVPIFNTAGSSMSFQALLRPDGRVVYNYKQISALPSGLLPSAGIQKSSLSVQSFGCGGDLPVQSGQTIELRPQPEATMWASLAASSSSGTIAPGGQATLPVRMTWAPMATGWPASADILVESNDPLRPTSTLSARMVPAEAPYSLRLIVVHR